MSGPPREKGRNLNALRHAEGLLSVEVRTREEAAGALAAALRPGPVPGAPASTPTVVLLTGHARCGKTGACAAALRQLGMRARDVDLMEPQSLAAAGGGDGPQALSGGGSCETLGKYNWCGDARACAVVVEDIDTALAVLGQPGQALLLSLLQRTARARQPAILTSSVPEPLSGSGRTIRAVAKLVRTHIRFAAPNAGTGTGKGPGAGKAAPRRASAASESQSESKGKGKSEGKSKDKDESMGTLSELPHPPPHFGGGITEAVLLLESFASAIESPETALLMEVSEAMRRLQNNETLGVDTDE